MKKSTFKKIGIAFIALILSFSVYVYVKIEIKSSKREISCFNRLAERLSDEVLPKDVAEEDLNKLQYLVEYSLVARTEMLGVYNRLRVDKDSPIHSRDLITLKQGTEDYLDIRKELLRIANSYECGLEVSDETL